MRSNKLRLFLSLMILGPVLVYWGFSGTPSEYTNRNQTKNNFDYFMNGIHSIQYDENGHIRQATAADRVEHSPRNKENQLQGPSIKLYRQEKPPITVKASSAQVDDNSQVVTLQEDVRVITSRENGPDSELKTEQLTLYPDQRILKTDVAVSYTRGQNEINAEGMRVDLKNDSIELLSNVKGHHSNAQ